MKWWFSTIVLSLLANSMMIENAVATAHSYQQIIPGIEQFRVYVNSTVAAILVDTELQAFVEMMWKGFALLMIVHLTTQFIFDGLDHHRMFGTIFLIALVHVFMEHYVDILDGLWGWAEGFSGGIQRVAIGNQDLMFAVGFIEDLVSSISISQLSFFEMFATGWATILLAILTSLLTLLSFFATVWGFWGFSLAKMIGFMFIPLILFHRLSWLFDGWLRFTIGFLLYSIIARVNLVLVVLLLKSYFGITSNTVPMGTAYFVEELSISSVFGLLAFLFVGVIALLSTGKFVASLTGTVPDMGSRLYGMVLGKIA